MAKFIFKKDCKDDNVAFWLTEAGSICRKYHANFIACIATDDKCNTKLLELMILQTNPKTFEFTVENLNTVFQKVS